MLIFLLFKAENVLVPVSEECKVPEPPHSTFKNVFKKIDYARIFRCVSIRTE